MFLLEQERKYMWKNLLTEEIASTERVVSPQKYFQHRLIEA